MKLTPVLRPVTDTGWRDIRGLLINGWKAHTFLARREGDEVRWVVRALSGVDATTRTFLPGIPGFFPGVWTQVAAARTTTTNFVMQIDANGDVQGPGEYVAYSPYSGHLSFSVPGVDMPTVFPGLPAFL